MDEGGAVLERATSEALFAALEEQPYPTVTQLRERFGLADTAYTLLDAHYSVRYVQTFRPADHEALHERLALLGDAVAAAVREGSGQLAT